MKYYVLYDMHSTFGDDAVCGEMNYPNISIINETNDMYPIDHHKNYMYIEALEDNCQVMLSGTENIIEYSFDTVNWTQLEPDTYTPAFNIGERCIFRGKCKSIENKGIGTFNTTKQFNVGGNIMSMLFGDDFEGKIDLTGYDYAFQYLFVNSQNIISAKNLILPATTLSRKCYYEMFYECTSLTTAPDILPAITLTYECYARMFAHCTSLNTAPELPATTLAYSCYISMFYKCYSLTTAPELPATTLANNCYQSMFNDCSSLRTAPSILPATTLTNYCYGSMFYGCTKLETAPELPATELTPGCYNYMFYGCSSLVNAPSILPATTLTNYCYQSMFRDCKLVNSITMLATDISATNCLQQWVQSVASTGTFTKHPNMTTLPTGTSGIPSGWTVVDYVS